MSGEKTHDRASERTARPKFRGRATDVEIVHTEKLLRDLKSGIRNLRELRPAPYNLAYRLLEHAGKIRAVERKLIKLRQGRLL